MKVLWKCTTDNCEELKEFETKSNFEIDERDGEQRFADVVYCWQCGEPHILRLIIKPELEKYE